MVTDVAVDEIPDIVLVASSVPPVCVRYTYDTDPIHCIPGMYADVGVYSSQAGRHMYITVPHVCAAYGMPYLVGSVGDGVPQDGYVA